MFLLGPNAFPKFSQPQKAFPFRARTLNRTILQHSINMNLEAIQNTDSIPYFGLQSCSLCNIWVLQKDPGINRKEKVKTHME